MKSHFNRWTISIKCSNKALHGINLHAQMQKGSFKLHKTYPTDLQARPQPCRARDRPNKPYIRHHSAPDAVTPLISTSIVMEGTTINLVDAAYDETNNRQKARDVQVVISTKQDTDSNVHPSTCTSTQMLVIPRSKHPGTLCRNSLSGNTARRG